MVTNSYLNRLRKYKTTWYEEWENICNKELLIEHLSKKEKEVINKLNLNLDNNIKNNNDICKLIVKNRINNIVLRLIGVVFQIVVSALVFLKSNKIAQYWEKQLKVKE